MEADEELSRAAGYFLYFDLSSWLPETASDEQGLEREREYALAQKLLEGGVGSHHGEEHSEVSGHFRLVFSHDKKMLAEVLRWYIPFNALKLSWICA